MSENLSSANTSYVGPNLTVDEINRVAAEIRALGIDPLEEFMRHNGYDPETDWLVVPESLRAEITARAAVPRFLKFSTALRDRMLFLRDPTRAAGRRS